MSRAVSAHPRWFVGLLPTAKQLALWIVSIVIIAFASAYAASYFTRQDNLELAFKQQQLSDIQRFQSGATALDVSFQAFNDALTTGKGIEPARSAMRTAIAHHASDTFALKRVFGDEQATAYVNKLADWGEQVSAVKSPQDAMPMAQTGVDLIEQRQQMVKLAEAKIETA